MEAEYIALNAAGKESMWLKKLENEVGYRSQPIIKTAQNFIHNDRSKHITLDPRKSRKWSSINQLLPNRKNGCRHVDKANLEKYYFSATTKRLVYQTRLK